ncbi:MAG: helix-turn-helix domain-containing protein [Vicinamibacterales bacterium]|nr:helix-turn-helix domain-containing protein [Vicinamibacterales bacterium]
MTREALITIEEAAARLGISRRAGYDLVAQGKLEAIRVGRLLRVEPAAIERFKVRNRVRVERPLAETPVRVPHPPVPGQPRIKGADRYL